MKKLLICLLCIGFLCCLSSPVHSITSYSLGDDDGYPPPGVPPTLPSPGTEPYNAPAPYSLTPEQVAVVIEVYNDSGTLVYTEKRIITPNSNLNIDTDNWKKGNYTAYIKTANTVIKTITINCE